MNGFGIASGPSSRPKGQSPFQSPPPPPSSIVAPHVLPPPRSSPRKGEIPEIMQSPAVAFQNSRSGADLPFSSGGIVRRMDPRGNNDQKAFPDYNNTQRLQRPSVVTPFSTSNIFKPNLPGNIAQVQDLKGSRPPGNNFRNIGQDANGMRMDPRWNNEQKAFPDYNNPQMLQRPAAVTSFSSSTNFGPNVPAKIHEMQDIKRSRSPGSDSRVINQDVNGSRERAQCDYSDLLTYQESSPVSPFVDPQGSQEGYPTEPVDGQIQKRTRSPSLPFSSEVQKENYFLARDTAKRPSMSPPIQVTRSNTLFHTPGSETRQRFPVYMHNGDSEASDTKAASFPATKRTRSPPVPSSDQFFQGNSSQDETEREMQAKAKRLARFKVELLHQTMPDSSDTVNQKFVGNKHDHPMAEKRKSAGEQFKETVGDFPSGSALAEYEDLEASSVIIGLCPDMCPESERAERERKGDLDHYERLGGDRNQTSKSMAIKKYNRTAEREAGLIRPMPVLRNTIDYLLNLLDQSYDDKFLGMYNFLWDRMRAIRMDLRMQHIFNLGAIAMLEQMIRLHIIAMHELCEYTKGEGFSEGFDAHLNIEQMNKTSVELFQMYDDHRKKGVDVPTEKEFRGYYALLKLDKHPGYKVEPSELSLDLAKMTPEIRKTPEVLFARDVARACRTGNFIAFFRLARRASYLQACLMHAHFSKLRTQALASLHSGLQNNQGLPVSIVAKWLAMEEEDIESLSDYHGFLLKEFEEPYMVKDGPFLNSEKDYATYCSKLVQQKRSRTICEDVSSYSEVVSFPAKSERKPQVSMVYKHGPLAVQTVKTPSPTFVSDEDMPDSLTVPSPKDRMRDMPDSLTVPSPKDHMRAMPLFAVSINQQSRDDHQMASVGVSPWNFLPDASPRSQPVKVKTVEKQNVEILVDKPLDKSLYSDAKPAVLPISPGKSSQEISPVSRFEFVAEVVSQNAAMEEDLQAKYPEDIPREPEPDKAVELYHEKEAADAKLKLILRIWKLRASKKKEQRMQRLLAANAAMNSLSLGPLIRHKRDEPRTSGEFNIDRVMWERYKEHGSSWSKLNVSDVVVDQLSQRNSETKCICFKIVVCSHMDDTERKASHTAASASLWLRSKLIPGKEDVDNDLVKSLPGLSIWKKWLHRQYNADLTCCLSVIKDAKFDNLNETVLGASAVIFLVSERISWELQKTRLQSLLISLPTNSRVPLLILTDSCNEDLMSNVLMDKMGLSESDDTRISGVRVLPLVKNPQVGSFDGFFSDEQLREGLQWLASESPLQPVLYHVRTRELVMARLNDTLESFNEMNVYEVGPNHCISALNEVLDQTISVVTETANSNPSNWPCPEINLLDEFSAEHKAYKMYLPNVGWSSATKIEPLVCALMECKLPAFSYDISWLGRGSITGEEIASQRSLLERYISRYMTESCKMDSKLAANEARIMLQKNAVLELHNSTYYIIPRWVMIFRRLFNWRLTMLASGIISSAYISQWESDVPPVSGFETGISSSYNLTPPPLDEMVEVSCSPLQSKQRDNSSAVQRCKDQSTTVSNHHETPLLINTAKSVVNESNKRQGGGSYANEGLSSSYRGSYINEGLSSSYGGSYINEGLSSSYVLKASESTLAATSKTEGDKLSKLLENCNILQNMIHEKLSVYF